MKKNFKKSKIIVPALALITATTAASVTGTVAWFTANRAATVTATSFHTTTLSSNLNVLVSQFGSNYSIGATTNDTKESDSGSVTIDGYLTHGSYAAQKLTSDGATETGANLYTPLMDSSKVTGYASQGRAEAEHTDAVLNEDQTTKTPAKDLWKAGTKTESGESKNVWYAVAWKMTFTVDASLDGVTSTLHFDPATTTFTDSIDNGTTIAGLRVALMTKSSFVVAAGDNKVTHVSGEGTISTSTPLTASFDSANFVNVVSTTTPTYPADHDTDLKTKATNYYLGDIDATNGLTVIAVAWYEGTDASIVTDDDTVMSNVTASLAFYSRQA